MAAVLCHSMIAKDDQSGVLIHLLDDLFNRFFDVVHLLLQLWVPYVVAMTSVVHPNQVRHHEVEV